MGNRSELCPWNWANNAYKLNKVPVTLCKVHSQNFHNPRGKCDICRVAGESPSHHHLLALRPKTVKAIILHSDILLMRRQWIKVT